MNNISLKEETHPLTWRLNKNKNTLWIDEYKNKNGYRSIYIMLKKLSPLDVINKVINSKLKGRGGAGFLTGIKWQMVFKNSSNNNRYLICNADEMEPGSYKDRFLMEKLPHLLIEGMIIAAYAMKLTKGYIFIRGEYIEPKNNLHRAILESYDNKLLGKNIIDSDFSFDIVLHASAGRYICGEETALMNALEGKRANPRFKPPFPSSFGVWGNPTCINNVETLCNLPAIVINGASWYKNLSLKNSKDCGTKLMGFSGKVNNPGIWELPFGITAREILEIYAGGIKNGLKLKAWLPGGTSSGLLTVNELDTPMDFENISRLGSRLGTAMAIAIDNSINIVSLMLNIEKFFARESCGLCTPCRDGLPWSVNILRSLEKGNGKIGDIELLEMLCKNLSIGKTFCAHAPGAMEPLKNAIKYFRPEFESGIKKNNSIIGIYRINNI